MSPRARGLALVLTVALGGCRDRAIGWEFRLAPELRERARGIEAHVVAGECGQERVASYRFARGQEPPVPAIGLEPGTWSFEVEAFDAECGRIGRGCQRFELPTDEERVTIDVAAIAPEPPLCKQCVDGLCQQAADGGAS